jgi:hypothetical protein
MCTAVEANEYDDGLALIWSLMVSLQSGPFIDGLPVIVSVHLDQKERSVWDGLTLKRKP